MWLLLSVVAVLATIYAGFIWLQHRAGAGLVLAGATMALIASVNEIAYFFRPYERPTIWVLAPVRIVLGVALFGVSVAAIRVLVRGRRAPV